MGYTTKFKGVLKFSEKPTVEMLAALNEILGGVCPDEYGGRYVQFQTTKDMTGIEWDHGEKFYYAEMAAQFVIDHMRKSFPSFGLVGELLAQGEERDDKWVLSCSVDKAEKIVVETIDITTCPHCAKDFTPKVERRSVRKSSK